MRLACRIDAVDADLDHGWRLILFCVAVFDQLLGLCHTLFLHVVAGFIC